MIRILIVDDRPEVRYGLQMRLTAEPDMEIVGTAGDGTSALICVADLCPDVVLMDVEMPGQDGIETSCALHRRFPGARVVLLTIHDDAATRSRAAGAHVTKFVSKEKSVDCLLSAIRDAAGPQANCPYS